LFGQTDSVAQQPDTLRSLKKFTYTNQFLFGVTIGDEALSMHPGISTFHGVRYKRASVGVDLSYDNYDRWKVLSPGLGATYDFLSTRNYAFHVQANAAYSKLWYQRSDNDNVNREVKRGRQFEALVGYRLKIEKVRLYVSAGFRSQQIEYSDTPRWWFLADMTSQPVSTVTRTINGVVVRFGLGI
jgi:hypothetical protein